MLSSKICPSFVLLRSTFVTSSTKCRKDKAWENIKRAAKAKEDEKWEKIQNSNIFQGNIGARHQMKAFGMEDPSDVNLVNMFEKDAFQLPGNESQIFQEAEDVTEKSRILSYGSKKKANRPSKDILKRILTKKRYFPDPRDPPLLTWVEKETIKSLHNMDKTEWTVEKLAEGFPVTQRSLKLFIKSRYVMSPREIKAHDDEVFKNWALLSKGKLEISDELQNHLAEFSDSIAQGARAFMSDEPYQKLIAGILENHQKCLMPLKRTKKGEFGSIISDFNKKLEALNPPKESSGSKPVIKMQESSPDLLQKSWKDTLPDFSSPTSGTAMMGPVPPKFHREKEITLAKFKKDFMERNRKKFDRSKEKLSPEMQSAGQTYFDWYDEEQRRDHLKDTRPVTKLSSEDIDHEIEELNRGRFFKLPHPHPTQEINDDHRYKVVKPEQVRPGEPLQKVTIPTEQYVEGAIYKMNNCVYDADGEFLYRVTNE